MQVPVAHRVLFCSKLLWVILEFIEEAKVYIKMHTLAAVTRVCKSVSTLGMEILWRRIPRLLQFGVMVVHNKNRQVG